jgi:hypothetical protein
LGSKERPKIASVGDYWDEPNNVLSCGPLEGIKILLPEKLHRAEGYKRWPGRNEDRSTSRCEASEVHAIQVESWS